MVFIITIQEEPHGSNEQAASRKKKQRTFRPRPIVQKKFLSKLIRDSQRFNAKKHVSDKIPTEELLLSNLLESLQL